jgi:FMN phosphatase YigB (HAD superfamily)/nitrite reductase/ring-hydroxylating ferredoxin subunit
VAVADGRAIVARTEEGAVAFENRCLHQDSPLAGGQIKNGKLTCPLHFWRYLLPGGEHVGGQGALPAYPVEVIDGQVFVEVPDAEPALSFREQMLRHAAEWEASRLPTATTVVWDMGGVFQRYFTEVLVDEGKARGWPLERMPLGPTGLADDDDYRRMTRGELTEPEYLAGICATLEREGIDFDPVNDPDYSVERRTEVWDLIEEIARRPTHAQAILTNDATRWMGEEWWTTWEERHFFNEIVDVAVLEARKPAPETYRAVLARLGVDPSTCVFIDDMPVNCRGAETVGMQSVWFDIATPRRSVVRLRERIGLP